jgi:glycosyltransferase involved in cell wall biosynthesis
MIDPTVATPPVATVSVIIPCFNYGRFLDGCLRSVLTQRGVSVRVLVIDDRSTDDSADVAARVCAPDDRVEFRAHRVNAGLIATANEGLEWADCEHVMLLSADDLLVPGALWRASTIMTRNPNVGLVYGRALEAPENRPLPTSSGRWRGTTIWRGRDWIRIRCRTAHNAMSSPTVLVRNRVQREVGGYDPGLHHTSDLNMWLRVAAVADVAYVRGAPQAIYRVLGESMSRTLGGPIVDFVERRNAFDSWLAHSPARVSEADLLVMRARRALARQALWRASRTVDHGVTEEQRHVDELVAFALDTFPGARRLPEWHGLKLRRRFGPGRSRMLLPFAATGAAHRLSGVASRARWRATGV